MAEQVSIDCQVNAGFGALSQHHQARLCTMSARDGIPAGMRRIETRIDAPDQRMRGVMDAVAVDAPFLIRQRLAFNVIEVF